MERHCSPEAAVAPPSGALLNRALRRARSEAVLLLGAAALPPASLAAASADLLAALPSEEPAALVLPAVLAAIVRAAGTRDEEQQQGAAALLALRRQLPWHDERLRRCGVGSKWPNSWRCRWGGGGVHVAACWPLPRSDVSPQSAGRLHLTVTQRRASPCPTAPLQPCQQRCPVSRAPGGAGRAADHTPCSLCGAAGRGSPCPGPAAAGGAAVGAGARPVAAGVWHGCCTSGRERKHPCSRSPQHPLAPHPCLLACRR